jgi:voltage-gated potassium channel
VSDDRLSRLLHPRQTTRHVVAWIAAVVMVALAGAVGYMVIEGWSFLDALYMSVITLTTTGFKEVHPMDTAGLIWTMVLAVAAIAIIFGTVGVVAQNIITEVASGARRERRMARTIAGMQDHFIVCGYGRVGSLVARELLADLAEVVVIDVGEESLQRAEADGYPVVHGDGTSDEVLLKAGVQRARGLVTCIDSDAHNVYVTLTARALNPKLFIVGRAGTQSVIDKLVHAGADRAVSPYVMAGRRIANLALKPLVVEYIEAALSRGGGDVAFSMEEVEVRAGGPLVGRTIGDLRGTGVLTLSVIAGGRQEPNPPDERTLAVGEYLIVSGEADKLKALEI